MAGFEAGAGNIFPITVRQPVKKQDLDFTAGRFAADETGGKYGGIIENQDVASGKQGR